MKEKMPPPSWPVPRVVEESARQLILVCTVAIAGAACLSPGVARTRISIFRVSRREGQPDAARVLRRNYSAVRQDLPHVVEHDHAVA